MYNKDYRHGTTKNAHFRAKNGISRQNIFFLGLPLFSWDQATRK
jgi:hypothetical protein